MPDNEIKLKIVIEDKEALTSISLTDSELKKLVGSVREAGIESKNSGEKIVHAFAQARNLIQGLKETFSMFAQTFSSHIIAYQQQEAALIKLNTALKQTDQYTSDNVKALTDYAAKLQQTTIYGDDVTETVMAQLLAMGLTVEQTKQATLQAANLATVMGTDLNSAARAMADLFAGNTGMIGRYVKGLDETIIKSGDLNEIIAMLNERIGGQAEAIGKTSVGALARMNNAIGELKENTGELLSKALGPFVNMISDIVKRLNELSPSVSGAIGLVASMTTAFITLRVTGILPAISSINLFGVALTGLKVTLIKTGIGALIVALGYGLSELAKAYEKWQNAQAQADESFNRMLDQIRSDAANAKKEELNWMLKEAETEKEKLAEKIRQLKQDIQASKKEVITKDKEGFEYRRYEETDESKRLAEQLKQTEQLLQLEEEKIKIYKDVNEQKKQTIKLSDEEIKDEFEKNKSILLEKQRHEQVILKLTEDNDLLQLEQKKKHLQELLKLYKSYGQDVTQIVNQLAETELEIKVKSKAPEIKIEDVLPFDAEELADIQYGNVLDYARLSKLQELEIWRKTEIEKAAAYENSAEVINAIEEEYARRRNDIRQQEAQQALDVYSQVFANLSILFGKHTAAYKAMAIAQAIIETYKAATAALSPPPVGAGPLLGPILAITTLAAGFANVQKIASTNIPGFQQGGRLRKGETGFIEGFQNEIIAPEKTFVEVFKQELKPKIYAGVSERSFGNIDNSDFVKELKGLRKDLQSGGIVAVAYLDDSEAKKIVSKGNYLNNKLKL